MHQNFIIEDATPKDILDIEDLLYPTHHEQSFFNDLEYDPVSARKYARHWMDHECVIEKDGEQIIGVAHAEYFRTYFTKDEASIEIFYVDPNYRKTSASRELLNALLTRLELRDVCIIHANCASGVEGDNNTLFVNLFKKYGFEILGTNLTKKI